MMQHNNTTINIQQPQGTRHNARTLAKNIGAPTKRTRRRNRQQLAELEESMLLHLRRLHCHLWPKQAENMTEHGFLLL
jgi:hypothetical protein